MQSQLLSENPQCVRTPFICLQKPRPGLCFLPPLGCELLGAVPSKLRQAEAALGSPGFGFPPGLTIWGLWRGQQRVSGDGEAVSWLWLAWGHWCVPPAHLVGCWYPTHAGMLLDLAVPTRGCCCVCQRADHPPSEKRLISSPLRQRHRGEPGRIHLFFLLSHPLVLSAAGR